MRMRAVILWLAVVSLGFAFGAGQVMADSAKKDESLRMGEKRQTLDPSIFSNNPRIKEAYRVAKEIPWVLDSIYCYCYCEESPTFRHKSLLSCYVDNHAAM